MDNKAYENENRDDDKDMVTSFCTDDDLKPSKDATVVKVTPTNDDDLKPSKVDVVKVTPAVDAYEKIDLTDEMNPDEKITVVMVTEAEADEKKSLAEKPYADMGKEDLLRFSSTPFWNRVRIISVLIFWLAWLALLGAVIGLTIVAPRCKAQPTPDWWQKSVIYQVYVRSFFDYSGDGIGDIQGIIAKLDFFKSLNVSAILLSSVFLSHNENASDYGYQVLNHEDVDPFYGTRLELEQLINATHAKGIKVILDFIPNYTGDRHQWFTASSASSDYSNPFWNYYVWADCVDGGPPPNNWLSVYGQSAWTYNATRGQCYLHQFLDSQPELNLRSAGVQNELEKILRFWLELGVDGFRVTNAEFLYESADFKNETRNDTLCADSSNQYDCYEHTNTRLLPETYEIIARWRTILDEYTKDITPDRSRILLTDADVGVADVIKYYDSAHLPINYALSRLNGTLRGTELSTLVRDWLSKLPESSTATWLTSDQDRSRLASCVDPTLVRAVTMLKLSLPGTAFVYYGEEIGMTDAPRDVPRQDPAGFIDLSFSRDPYRTPMQWTNNTQHAGFINDTGSGGTPVSDPWLPVNTYPHGNVSVSYEDQLSDVHNSLLMLSTNMTLLRSEQKSLAYGRIHYTYASDNIFSFVREHEGNDRLLVFLNVGNETEGEVDLTKPDYSIDIPKEAKVVMVTDLSVSPAVGKNVDLRKLTMKPGQGLVASWKYTRPL